MKKNNQIRKTSKVRRKSSDLAGTRRPSASVLLNAVSYKNEKKSNAPTVKIKTETKKRILPKDSPTEVRSAGKKNTLLAVGGRKYSKAILAGSLSNTSANINLSIGAPALDKSADGDGSSSNLAFENLQFLEGTNQLFFRRCKTFPPELSSFKPKNKRGIWNASGRVVYYTGEKSSYICRSCHYSGFSQEVVDYSGKSVLTANGRQFVFGLNSYVEILLEGNKLLGTMTQSCLNSTYEIKDCSGRLIYKIQAPCFAPCAPFVFWCCKEHFEICLDDGVSEIGKITKYWDTDVAIPEFQNCLGIEMDRADDVRVKALLLGCFFLIEFQYYKWGGNGYIYFILMLILFASIVAASECAGYCPFWLDKTIGLERVEIAT